MTAILPSRYWIIRGVTANRAIFAVILFSNGRCAVIFGVTTVGLAYT